MIVRISRNLIRFLIFNILFAGMLYGLVVTFSPMLGHFRPQLQTLASNMMNHPVRFGRIDVGWQGMEPVLSFADVVVLNESTDKVLIKVKRMELGVNYLGSIVKRKFVPDKLTISGAHLVIRQDSKGMLSVDGIQQLQSDNAHTLRSGIEFKPLLAWLFSEKRIALRNLTVDWVDASQVIQHITAEELAVVNEGDEHRFLGRVTIKQAVPSTVKLVLVTQGDLIASKDWTAKLYLKTENFRIEQWLKYVVDNKLKLQGSINSEIWMDIIHGRLTSMQMHIAADKLGLRSAKREVSLPHVSGNVAWVSGDDGWRLWADKVQVVETEQRWPEGQWLLEYDAKTHSPIDKVYVSHLGLNLLSVLATSTEFAPEQLRRVLGTLKMDGNVDQFNFENQSLEQAPPDFALSANVSNLRTSPWNMLPGLQGITGRLEANVDHARLVLDSDDAALNFNGELRDRLKLDTLHATVNLDFDEGAWQLWSDDLLIDNADVLAQSQFKLQFDNDLTKPQIDLQTNYSIKQVSNMRAYYPVKRMPADLVKWLDEAIVSGAGGHGTLVLRGPLNRFPFEDNSGVMMLVTQANGLTLNYKNGWPTISDLDLEVTIRNRRLDVSSQHGFAFNGRGLIQNMHASIDKMVPGVLKELTVSGKIKGDLDHAYQFVQASPLKGSVGRHIDALTLQGPMELDLNLMIPISKDKLPMQVKGDIVTENGTVSVPQWDIQFDKLQGSLHFTEDDLTAKQLKAVFYKEPMFISLKNSHEDGFNETDINFLSRLHVNDIKQRFDSPWLDHLSGDTAFAAQLKFSDKPGAPSQLYLNSDLRGVGVDLPAPYHKSEAASKALRLHYTAQAGESSNLQFNYAHQLDAALSFDNQQEKPVLLGGELHLGDGEAHLQQEPGLLLTGELENFSLKTWLPYLQQVSATEPSATEASLIRYGDLWFNNVDVFGQQFKRLRLQLSPKLKAWLFKITSPQIEGELNVATDIKRGVSGKLNKLYLSKFDKTDKLTSLNPSDFIPLNLSIDDFRYGNRGFGGLDIALTPSETAVKVNRLHIINDVYGVEAKGYWKRIDGESQSAVSGAITSHDLGRALLDWGLPAAIEAEDSSLDIDLAWPGELQDFSMDKAKGSLGMKLENGRISDLGEETEAKLGLGKLLSILSLQTLPRRLHLDFSDLTHRGFSFDSLQGNFAIDKGIAYTQDTDLDGPVADVGLRGSIDMASKAYEIDLTVKPHVTSSLPIVATIVGGPVAGILTWAADKIIGKEVSKAAGFHYKMTGPWEKPEIVQLH